MVVRCEFKICDDGYTCRIEGQIIPSEVSEESFQGNHKGIHTIGDVKVLNIKDSKFEKIDKIGEVFKNVTRLMIQKTNTREISKKNLRRFPNLEKIELVWNQLEYLPGDLFEFNKKLKLIWLYNNKIKFIGPELLDGLPNLINVNLQFNENISSKFDYSDPCSPTLNQLKEEIKSKCKPPHYLLWHKHQKLIKDLGKFLALDDFKDFTIKVGSKDFKVHKFIFIARSPTFAEMIKNNPDAEELVLTDIPVEVFESILDFVYTDQPPNNPRNAREIFAAAGKLKIESLMEISGEILMKEMEKEENLDFLMENLNLGLKFHCEKMKLKAFDGIKKQFSDGELKSELLENPTKLKTLIEAKKMIMEFVVKKDVASSAK